MKHFTFLKSLLLLCALVVGSNGAWADETTISVGSSSLTWTADGNDYKATSGDFNLRYEKGTYTNSISGGIQSAELRLYSGTNFVISSTNTITKIVYNVADGSGKNYSVSALSTADGNLTNGTWTGSATSVSASLSAQNRIKSVTITYTAGAKTDPTITFNDGNVRVGKTLDLSTLFDSDSEGAVTYSITEGGSYATLSGSTLTGTAVGSVTVKAEQAAAGSYNAGEASATITVQEALTLSSIAITTAPTKTTYTEGETFDATGMVVTATYSDSSTDDVTAQCTWIPSGALTTADDKITVSYTENATTKTAEQAITVNEYVQPNPVTIQMTNSLFGEEVHTTGKSTQELTFVGTQDGVTVTYYVPNDSYYYFNTSNTRPYDTCTLDYAAPAGYAITKIDFTSDGSNWNTATPSIGTMTGTKQWEGFAPNVTFSWATSGTRIKTVVVTLANTAPVSIAATKEWITFCCAAPLDFSSAIDGLEGAYTITGHSSGATTLTATKMAGTVMAGTGLLLHAATVDTENAQVIVIPVAESGTEQTNNMLVGVTTGTTVNPTESTNTNLGLKNGSFVPYSAAGTLAAGKAYLQIPTADMPASGAKLTIIFDDGETTSIDLNAIDNLNTNGQMYNLAGQKVSKSYKGIVIMNGRKFINK